MRTGQITHKTYSLFSLTENYDDRNNYVTKKKEEIYIHIYSILRPK